MSETLDHTAFGADQPPALEFSVAADTTGSGFQDGSEVVFRVAVDSDRCCVRVCGELDEDTSAIFSGVVSGLLGHGCVDLSVDLAGLTFFDLRGFAALASAQSLLGERGGRLQAVNYDRLFAVVARWWGADGLLGDGTHTRITTQITKPAVTEPPAQDTTEGALVKRPT